jgi:hypothetical protein
VLVILQRGVAEGIEPSPGRLRHCHRHLREISPAPDALAASPEMAPSTGRPSQMGLGFGGDRQGKYLLVAQRDQRNVSDGKEGNLLGLKGTQDLDVVAEIIFRDLIFETRPLAVVSIKSH